MWITFDQLKQKIIQFDQQEGVMPLSGLGHLFTLVHKMSWINRVYLHMLCRLKHKNHAGCFDMYYGMKKHFYNDDKTWDNIHAYFKAKASAQRPNGS
jgi:hypothetical protein